MDGLSELAVVLPILHGLRTKGVATADEMAAASGLAHDQVETALATMADQGWVRYRDGRRVKGWMLLGEGRAEGERLIADQLEGCGARGSLEALYQRFLVLDPELKKACTDFQLKEEQEVNDHCDPSYDAAVIARLGEINRQVQPIVAELAAVLDRFGHYGGRLATALGRVLDGEIDWFTKPTVDSYHEVWFELHEDLLVTLGIDRASEQAAPAARA